jgi:hypothetical protein
MEFDQAQPQLQVQMLMERPQDLERIVTDVQILKSPIILFIKWVQDIESKPYIYWFGYTLGKTRNIFWGTYNKKEDSFKTKGICTFNELGSLNDTIDYKIKNGFEIIAQLTEDKIKQTFGRLRTIPLDRASNRMDLTQRQITEEKQQFFKKFAKRSLEYIEHNEALHKNTSRSCLEISRCRFREFGSNCDQYNWGIDEQLEEDPEIDIL